MPTKSHETPFLGSSILYKERVYEGHIVVMPCNFGPEQWALRPEQWALRIEACKFLECPSLGNSHIVRKAVRDDNFLLGGCRKESLIDLKRNFTSPQILR